MNDDKHSISLTEYEYDLLAENSMISMPCEGLLKSKKKRDGEVILSMTLRDLGELIGYIAAEANHTRSKRKAEDLNEVCDYLEAIEFDIKREVFKK